MKFRIVVILLCICACTEIITIGTHHEAFFLPNISTTAVLTDSRLVETTLNSAKIELDFIVLNAHQSKTKSTFEDALSSSKSNFMHLPASAITLINQPEDSLQLSMNDLVYTAVQPKESAVSIALLLDQSALEIPISYGSTNSVLEGINGLMYMTEFPDEFLVGTYQHDGGPVMELITPDFTQFDEQIALDISELPLAINGSTPLYEAISTMLDEIAVKANNPGKHLVVLAKGEDNSSDNQQTADEIISKAQELDISISIIWLFVTDNGFDWEVATKIPMQTNGFSVVTSYSSQANNVLLSVYSLLKNNESYYTLTAEMIDTMTVIPVPYQHYGTFNTIHSQLQHFDITRTISLSKTLYYYVE
jgi:hypothetical protein